MQTKKLEKKLCKNKLENNIWTKTFAKIYLEKISGNKKTVKNIWKNMENIWKQIEKTSGKKTYLKKEWEKI